MLFSPVCRYCSYSPCSVDASICPCCGKANPNPGVFARLGSLFAGAFVAAIIGGFGLLGVVGNQPDMLPLGIGGLALGVLILLGAVWNAFDPGFSSLRGTRRQPHRRYRRVEDYDPLD